MVLASPALADSQLVIDRPLSDKEFYRAVACGAVPGEACQVPLVRWSRADAGNLRVQVTATDAGFFSRHGARGERALTRAIEALNGTGSALRLARARKGAEAHVQIWFSDLAEGDMITLPGQTASLGDRMEGARVYVWWDGNNRIERASIVLSRDLQGDEIGSVLLEELTQAMGLLTDLEGSAYAESSIFSESSNAVTTLRGQDRMAIRQHYPSE